MSTRTVTVLLALGAWLCLHPGCSFEASGGAKEHGPCGGETGVQCAEGLWCDVKGACDEEFPPGVCVRIPRSCPQDRNPVCGCDGVTYQNDCDRLAHKMQKDHDGECTDEP